MNFNSEDSYIEYDSENLPYSLYEIHGLNKIRELSRQLRTFINYKTATIQYRFRPKTINYLTAVNKNCSETKKKLKQIATEFIHLLTKIKGKGISYESELIRMLERVRLAEDMISHNLLTTLRETTQNLFISIYELSEGEIHLNPKFLKFTVNLTQEACIVSKILNNWASGFYEELRVNYLQLYDELAILIPEERVEKIVREQKSLEEGLKEW
ncbi:MAG: hypothetical protein EU531_11375 [Promethearchaeota archaeon]|nr:MAG: hypothetical protein EU531_11375 [Candidatus Lokiarchaeota archaeon]